MHGFLKNYFIGFFLTLLYLPRLILALALILAPGFVVAWTLFNILPGDPSALGSIAGLATSIYVSTTERYGSIIAKVMPAGFTDRDD